VRGQIRRFKEASIIINICSSGERDVGDTDPKPAAWSQDSPKLRQDVAQFLGTNVLERVAAEDVAYAAIPEGQRSLGDIDPNVGRVAKVNNCPTFNPSVILSATDIQLQHEAIFGRLN